MAKLEDMLRATLHSACLPGWLNMQVTSEQHIPKSKRQKVFLLSTRNIWDSLAINFAVRYKVFQLAKLGDIEGTRDNVDCDMSLSLPRPLGLFC